mgnify:CR=1 FL=1
MHKFLLILFWVLSIVSTAVFANQDNFTISFSLYSLSFFAFFQLWKIREDLSWRNINITLIITGALLIPITPNLSPDYFRFLWDGQLILDGVNPYAYTPAELIKEDWLANSTYYQELFKGITQLSKENYSCYPSINQFYFAISNLFSNSIWINLMVMRVLIMGTLILLYKYTKRILKALKKEEKGVLLIFFNPFVLQELVVNLHFEGVMIAKFRNAGQTCVCANRIYVHHSIYDQFIDRLRQQVALLKVGNGLDDGVTIGPLINRAAVEKVERHIHDAMLKGAHLVLGSQQASSDCFITPTIIRDVRDDMLVATEETFGPLAAIFSFDDDQDVIDRANNTDSGLAAYIYTQSLSRAFNVSEALEYGMVGVNEGLISTELAPFGGVKESGLGREGAHQGLEEYTEMKYTLMGGI